MHQSPLRPKMVLRCMNITASKQFYSTILELPVVEQWEEEQGKGCVFAFDPAGQCSLFELYEMTQRDTRYTPAFSAPLTSDKIDLQLKADAVDDWVKHLQGRWPFEGPETLPWGQRWITLRDPDNLLIAIYEDPR